jgi:hypothetical protein
VKLRQQSLVFVEKSPGVLGVFPFGAAGALQCYSALVVRGEVGETPGAEFKISLGVSGDGKNIPYAENLPGVSAVWDAFFR